MILQPAASRLKKRQLEFGFEAKKSLGQNFLINDDVIAKIFKAIDLNRADLIIEIGPGLGALTDGLIQLSHDFIAIELDRRFAEYWRNHGITLIEADALRVNWNQFTKPYILVSNLPYQIASSVVVERSIDESQRCCQMILMFQKEVAARIRAQEKSSDFGFLSVLAQTFWSIQTVCDARPKDFAPAPKVASRVLSFVPKSNVLVSDRTKYLRFIKSSFLHPRKMVVGNWQEGLGLTRDQCIELALSVKLKETSRPHEIKIDQFINLYNNWIRL
jgi:16S rRNA (adenine1518-N6/adenine1519-N6)-dimethyltransferase